MMKPVVVTMPHKSVGHARDIMKRNSIQSIPVVNSDNNVVGIITATDLISNLTEGTPVKKIMTKHVYTIPKYEKIHIAARMMRNHHVHHLVVTHEQKVVGVISSYDLLKLVEEHRFEIKNPPTTGRKSTART